MEDRRALVIAFLVALLILVGGATAYFLRGEDTERSRPDRPAAAEAGDTLDALANAPVEEVAPVPVEPERIAPPSFDIVRVDPRGTATMAGRGASGATAIILANGEPLTETQIDSNGEWVVVLTDPLPVGSVQIGLTMRLPSGQEVRSEQVVVVSVPETRDREPLVILGSAGGASRVLQSPLEDTGQPLALLAVDYDDAGSVIFSGRAEPGSRVRVLANGKIVGEAQANDTGAWSLIAGSALAPGVYDLQIDQLDELGRVTGVVVAPFERASPEAVAAAQADAQAAASRGEAARTIVVQPGNSLWRISRRLYGSGWQYTVIYAANDDQIRDPDLIYPGQIFDVPLSDETGN